MRMGRVGEGLGIIGRWADTGAHVAQPSNPLDHATVGLTASQRLGLAADRFRISGIPIGAPSS
jgi:hypothetical protein